MKNWYLIKTKPRQEKKAKQNLENQGYVAFFPIAEINERLVVLFPGYLFVRLNEKTQNFSPINSTKGVSYFVKFGLNFAKVPSSVIEFIKTNQHISADKLKNLDKLKPGDKVQISDGVFKNWVAIFKCYKPDERVILLMNLLGNEQTLSLKKELVIAI
jgi:transcriptional antiterminator RfaH|tara:strand:+ start:272 stop:745 length:474 start_codon:yes stop_codon:yes gene_type:complete